jgi:hypothetical protein
LPCPPIGTTVSAIPRLLFDGPVYTNRSWSSFSGISTEISIHTHSHDVCGPAARKLLGLNPDFPDGIFATACFVHLLSVFWGVRPF